MRQYPRYPYRKIASWRTGLIVLGSLALPVVSNWASGLPIASADQGSGFIRIQDVSASVTLGLLLALPVELIAQAAHKRQVGHYREEVARLENENQEMRLQIQSEKERRLEEWRAELDSSREMRKRAYSPSLDEIDNSTHGEFEEIVRRLMERDGLKARVIGGRGDQAVDVLAINEAGGKIAVQCKHTTRGRKVDSRVLYQINGTAYPAYEAKESVVVTNGFFTRDATEWGNKHNIRLIGREMLEKWSKGADHLYQLIDLVDPI